VKASTWKTGLTRLYVLVWVLYAALATAALFSEDRFHEVAADRNATWDELFAADSSSTSTEYNLPGIGARKLGELPLNPAKPTPRRLVFPVVPLLLYFGLAFAAPTLFLVLLRWVFDGFTKGSTA
jgi:hypothetical protein